MSSLFPLLRRLCFLFNLISFASAQDGKIAQFLTDLCGDPSVINSIVTLPLDTCLVTQDAQALAVQLFPKCISGNKATLILYKDTLCAAIDPITWTNNSTCVAYSPSAAVPAVMFACDVHAGDQPQPTLTSTVAAGSPTALVPPATSPSQDSSGIPTSFTLAGLVASATPGSSTPPTSSQTGSSSASGQSNSNVSRNGQIALGVVLPLGAIVVAVLAWCYPKPWNQGKEGGKSGEQRQFHDLGL